jgi:hypothetical protein
VTHLVEAGTGCSLDCQGFVLADGVELVGPYLDGGFTESVFLARRADGRMAQLSELSYALEHFSTESDPETVARRVSEVSCSKVWPSEVVDLARHRLAPIGLVRELVRPVKATSSDEIEEGDEAELAARPEPATTLLGLQFKFGALRPETVNRIADILKPLFRPLVMICGIGASIVSYVLLVASGSASRSITALIDRPGHCVPIQRWAGRPDRGRALPHVASVLRRYD